MRSLYREAPTVARHLAELVEAAASAESATAEPAKEEVNR